MAIDVGRRVITISKGVCRLLSKIDKFLTSNVHITGQHFLAQNVKVGETIAVLES